MVTHRLTSKSKPEIIDCSGNPLDLRPAVDRLETMIRQHVAENPGQPLIVMMGESHSTPTHVATQQLLMQRLSDPKNNPLRIACGVEWPHNMVDEILGEPKFDRSPIPAGVRNHIAAGSNPEKQFLRAYHAVLAQNRAPLTHRNVMSWADKHNVSVRPVDAAWKPDFTLDQTDSLTNDIITREFPNLTKPVMADGSREIDAQYMRARNLAVVDRVQAHIADTKAQVYILPYGGTHLLGSSAKPEETLHHPHEDSLAKLFGDAGLHTLPVFIDDQDYLPAGAEVALGRGAVVRGLSRKKFANELTSKSENDFLHKINAQSGNTLRLYADHGTKVSFGYGPNFRPYSTLTPSSRATSRQRIIANPNMAAHAEKKKHPSNHQRRKPHPSPSPKRG